MAVDYKLIGERIKIKRRSKKITQEKLAELLDVTVGYVGQLERGITKINLDRLSEIADVLDTDITVLLGGSSYYSSNYLSDDIARLIDKLSIRDRALLYDILKLVNEHGK